VGTYRKAEHRPAIARPVWNMPGDQLIPWRVEAASHEPLSGQRRQFPDKDIERGLPVEAEDNAPQPCPLL